MPQPRIARMAVGVLLATALAAPSALGTTYEVGPGQPLGNVGDVPWESLEPGDLVLIHWRAAPYKEKWVLCRQGTAALPIVVRGVPGPGGELPVIDGDGATTRAGLDFWNEERGVIKIGGANVPADTMPAHIVLENLDVTSGRPPFQFTGRNGLADYASNAAALYIEKGQEITLRNLVIRDSGNGLFCGSQTSNLLVEGCFIHDNGIEGSIYEHNNYTAAVGITFQFNRFGPLRAACDGNNLKDRSVGTVIRYNWIESGNRQLDLVDAEDDPTLTSDPRYRTTVVYGNVLVEPDGAGNSQIVHYGGDSGNTSIYRKGTLFFFNNTLVSTRSGNTTLLRLSTDEEHADVRNNILYVFASGGSLAMLDGSGVLDLTNNWTKPGWTDSHSGLTGTIRDQGGAVTGSDPGFVSEVGQDFHLAPGSSAIDRGTALAPQVLPDHDLTSEYRPHQAGEPRPVDGPLDLGAFEACGSGGCVRPDAGAADGGSMPDSGDGGGASDAGESSDADGSRDAAPQDAGGTSNADGASGVDGSVGDHDGAISLGDGAGASGLATATGNCGCAAGDALSWALVPALAPALPGRRRRRTRDFEQPSHGRGPRARSGDLPGRPIGRPPARAAAAARRGSSRTREP